MKLILALPAVALLLSAATRITPLPQNQVAPAPPPVGAKMWADRTVLYKGETLLLHFQAPNAPYLGVIDPAGRFFYVVVPTELSVGKLKPMVDSREFENRSALSIPTASVKADPYTYGVYETRLVFTQSGAYTFILGDNLHTEDAEGVEKVVIQYHHQSRPKHIATADVAVN